MPKGVFRTKNAPEMAKKVTGNLAAGIWTRRFGRRTIGHRTQNTWPQGHLAADIWTRTFGRRTIGRKDNWPRTFVCRTIGRGQVDADNWTQCYV